ncbi:hypothetical protein AAC387_Pa02g1423 [Persea americana]
MEVLESPPCDVWIRFKGVSSRLWSEETFSLLADCVGTTMEVDPATARMEMHLFGRGKVSRDVNQCLPQRMFLWLDELCLPIEVEMETEYSREARKVLQLAKVGEAE